MIEGLEQALSIFEGLGPIGYVLFVGAYILGALILFPEALFTILAGALFGTFWGTLLAWCCANVAALAALLIARVLLRKRIEKRAEKNKWLKMTKVHLRDYLLATSLAILPGTVVYAFLGATGRALL